MNRFQSKFPNKYFHNRTIPMHETNKKTSTTLHKISPPNLKMKFDRQLSKAEGFLCRCSIIAKKCYNLNGIENENNNSNNSNKKAKTLRYMFVLIGLRALHKLT